MRGKRAKAYRKLIGDVSADYNEAGFHFKNFGFGKHPDWHKVTSQVKLTDTCGRAAYKTLKRIDS